MIAGPRYKITESLLWSKQQDAWLITAGSGMRDDSAARRYAHTAPVLVKKGGFAFPASTTILTLRHPALATDFNNDLTNLG